MFLNEMPYKVTAPVARSTAYDYNCQLTKCHLKATANVHRDCAVPTYGMKETRDVMPHEVLFERRSSLTGTCPRLRAMSSLNGVKLGETICEAVRRELRRQGCNYADNFAEPMQDADGALLGWLEDDTRGRAGSVKEVSKVLSSYFVYMGVAVTGCDSGAAGALQRQGFSATRGGLMTVVNTSRDTISAGQRLCMRIDVKDVVRQSRHRSNDHIDGIPFRKVLARIEAVPTDDGAFEDLYSGMRSNEIRVHLNEPIILMPDFRYTIRERLQWDQNAGDPRVARHIVNAANAAAAGGAALAFAGLPAIRAARAIPPRGGTFI